MTAPLLPPEYSMDQAWKDSQRYSVISGVAAFIVSKKIINLGIISSLLVAAGATYAMWSATKKKRDLAETNPYTGPRIYG